MTNATIWEHGSFYKDSFKTFEEGAERPSDLAGDLIIDLATFEAHDWSSHEDRLGLIVHAGDDIEAIAAKLDAFDLIVVDFPSFADGRAFSIARLIRDKYEFDGEIRAKGAYILDQMPLLQRCGVSTFEISSDAVKTGLERGAWPDVPRYYQFALDGEGNQARVRHVDAKRPWLSVNIVAEGVAERSAA